MQQGGGGGGQRQWPGCSAARVEEGEAAAEGQAGHEEAVVGAECGMEEAAAG